MSSVTSAGVAGLVVAAAAFAADGLPKVAGEVTFSKDIAPILQRSCQNSFLKGRRVRNCRALFKLALISAKVRQLFTSTLTSNASAGMITIGPLRNGEFLIPSVISKSS
jgi:hypothetical protein